MRKNKRSISVSYGSGPENKPATFTGTESGNKRKAVLKVSNPIYGTVKSVEKLDKKGDIKSSKTVDKFPGGKKVVTKVTLPRNENGLTALQSIRRNIQTSRANNLDKKGQSNLQSGNTSKAYKQFEKSDKIIAKRATTTAKAVSKNIVTKSTPPRTTPILRKPVRVDTNSLAYRKAELAKNQALRQAESAKKASVRTVKTTAPNKKLK